MRMTIRALTQNPLLKTHFLAGEEGDEREVHWAHTSEVTDPWNWLGEGDLLLTTGHNVPADPARQVEFIEKLHGVGLSGVAIGADFYAPPLSSAAIKTADTLGFPVLETAHEVPFALVAQTVAEHSATAGTAFVQVLRIYETYRRYKSAAAEEASLLDLLGRTTQAEFNLVDLDLSSEIMHSRKSLPETAITKIQDELSDPQQNIPAYTRVKFSDDQVAVVLPILQNERIVLVATSDGATRSIELQVFQHVAALMQAEVEKTIQHRKDRVIRSAQFLHELIHRSITQDDLSVRFHEFGLSGEKYQIYCTSHHHDRNYDLIFTLLDQEIGHLSTTADDVCFYLIDPQDADRFTEIFEDAEISLGTSMPLQKVQHIPDAAREARWALETAMLNSMPLALYERDIPVFLPRTIREAERTVEAILGPVIRYDQEHSAGLLDTLEVFFQHDKSWVNTSREMNIHKQTAVYRIQNIEKLTNKKLSRIEDQTAVYLALKTHRMLNSAGDQDS